MIIKRNSRKKKDIETKEIVEVNKENEGSITSKNSVSDNENSTFTTNFLHLGSKNKKVEEKNQDNNFGVIDFENIEFDNREERRRGERRRGYRRIDERNLVSRAQKEAIGIKEQAFQQGYQVGLEKVKDDVRILQEAINEFVIEKGKVLEKINIDILEISLQIARKVILQEVKEDKQILRNMINEILEQILPQQPTTITFVVSPFDLEYMKNILPEISSQFQIDAKVTVMQDANVQEGSVIIKTDNGIIDANLTTQLKILQAAFSS